MARRPRSAETERLTTEFLEKLGNNIKAIRKARNLSREQLTEMASLHETQLYLIEEGGINVQIKTLALIAAGLQIDPGDLLPSLGYTRVPLPDIGNPLYLGDLLRLLDRGQHLVEATLEFRDVLKDIRSFLDAHKPPGSIEVGKDGPDEPADAEK